MTVGTKLQQTLASAKTVEANLKQFALDTNDQQAKQMFQNLSQQMGQIVQQLEQRANYIQQQEPQYRGV